ncbi:MAG: Fur family transcriptional regulator, ferric uptake regulator [Solirubrobacteraceae bacterium]|nr:Fur family transcriptional regulator, ferric uptake regulator [Solirubrobacteraceae bacterium]
MTHELAHSSWSEHAAEQLTAAGYRRGGARDAVVDLLGRQGCALSALEIEAELGRGARRVARASIYRVLEELDQLKLISRVEVGQGIARFEPLHHGGDHHHHHLVCDRCGDLVPFADDGLEKAIDKVAARLAFSVSDHEITLHGSCKSCQSA